MHTIPSATIIPYLCARTPASFHSSFRFALALSFSPSLQWTRVLEHPCLYIYCDRFRCKIPCSRRIYCRWLHKYARFSTLIFCCSFFSLFLNFSFSQLFFFHSFFTTFYNSLPSPYIFIVIHAFIGLVFLFYFPVFFHTRSEKRQRLRLTNPSL